MKRIILYILVVLLYKNSSAKEYHVAKTGNDDNPEIEEKSFHTIKAAANIAQPCDTITVHQEVYREWI